MTTHQTWSYVELILKIYCCWRTDFTFSNAFIITLLNAWMCMENIIFTFISIWKKYFSNILIGNYCKWYNCLWLLIPTIKKNLQIQKLRRQHKYFWSAKKMSGNQLIKVVTMARTFFTDRTGNLSVWETPIFPFLGGQPSLFKKSWMSVQWSSPLPFKGASARQGAFCRTVLLRDPWLWNFWSVSW